MTFISLRPQPAALVAATPCNDFTLNRVLHPMDDPQWPAAITVTGLDKAACWGRKFEGAKFQYAHIMKALMLEYPQGADRLNILLPGGYEDPLRETLTRLGANVLAVDPDVNRMNLRQYVAAHETTAKWYWQADLVIAASVLEHVRDDAEFLRDIVFCLKPGGLALLTVDFKEGWKRGDPLVTTQERMYTRDSLMALTDTINREVAWLGERDWQSRGDYLPYEGLMFSFASIAFRKKDGEA